MASNNGPQITSRIQIASGHPLALTLADLQEFIDTARAAGVRHDAALWSPDASGEDALLYRLAVRSPAHRPCGFQGVRSGAGGDMANCHRSAVLRVVVPARDGATNQAGAQIQTNYRGEGTATWVCQEHADYLVLTYKAVADPQYSGHPAPLRVGPPVAKARYLHLPPEGLVAQGDPEGTLAGGPGS